MHLQIARSGMSWLILFLEGDMGVCVTVYLSSIQTFHTKPKPSRPYWSFRRLMFQPSLLRWDALEMNKREWQQLTTIEFGRPKKWWCESESIFSTGQTQLGGGLLTCSWDRGNQKEEQHTERISTKLIIIAQTNYIIRKTYQGKTPYELHRSSKTTWTTSLWSLAMKALIRRAKETSEHPGSKGRLEGDPTEDVPLPALPASDDPAAVPRAIGQVAVLSSRGKQCIVFNH